MSKLFIFVDESGDIGDPDISGSTDYYQLNILITSYKGIHCISRHLSEFRYFLNLEKELKEYWHYKAVRPKMINLIKKVHSNIEDIKSYVFYYDKKLLNTLFGIKDGIKIRNTILKTSLLYLEHDSVFKSIDSVELILDRYLDSKEQQESLRTLLQYSSIFPIQIHHISHIQSVYSDMLQYIDLVGRAVIDYGRQDLNLVFVDASKNVQ